MQIVSVVVAALASYGFGALWYMGLAGPWMTAAGVARGADGKPANRADPLPYVVAFVCALVVAGMMRHIFALAGIHGPGAGLTAGLGIGLFLATPWIATNYMFAGRPRMLIVIDGGYATIGCTIIGLILTLF